MQLSSWLELARADAERRGLPDLLPLLEALHAATVRLREARWHTPPDGQWPADAGPGGPRGAAPGSTARAK